MSISRHARSSRNLYTIIFPILLTGCLFMAGCSHQKDASEPAGNNPQTSSSENGAADIIYVADPRGMPKPIPRTARHRRFSRKMSSIRTMP